MYVEHEPNEKLTHQRLNNLAYWHDAIRMLDCMVAGIGWHR
jgi:hypothetical protein